MHTINFENKELWCLFVLKLIARAMEISTRTKQLKAIFSYDKKVILEDQPLEIRPYHFIQNMGVNEIEQFQQLLPTNEFCSIPDNNIQENIYP